MEGERRFRGAMSEEYRLLRLALPHFEELQARVGQAVADFRRPGPLDVLEIGCGSGVTSGAILAARDDVSLTALDSEEQMVRQARANLADDIGRGRCRVAQADALAYLRQLREPSADVVASALTLHNLRHDYRAELQREIFRALRPGGLFVNADKYTPQDEAERFRALGVALGRFFDAFVPLGNYELLRDWVLHNVADQGPDRVLREQDAVDALLQLGFRNVRLVDRNTMEAVLLADKPDAGV